MGSNMLWWTWSLLGAGIVITVVAVLLGLIIAAAQSVDRHARAIWCTGKQITQNTVSIWILASVYDRLERTKDAVQKLDENAASISESLRVLAEKRS